MTGRTAIVWSVGLAGMFCFFTSIAAADPVKVRASRGGDFGRIAFAWPTPVTHKLSVKGARFTIRFGRPIEASYNNVPGALRAYVKSVKPGADGRSVDVELTRKFDVYGYDSGRTVFVEIAELEGGATPEPATSKQASTPVTPKSEKTPEPKKSPVKTAAGSTLPKIKVRTGAHAAYTRVVFDWPKKVDYTLTQKGGVVSVRFAREVDLQVQALRRRPSPYIGAVRTQVSDGATTLTIAVAASSTVKHFPSGPKLVLDVRRPTGDAKIAKLPPVPTVAPKSEPGKEVKKASEPAPSETKKLAAAAAEASSTKTEKAEAALKAPKKTTAEGEPAKTETKPATETQTPEAAGKTAPKAEPKSSPAPSPAPNTEAAQAASSSLGQPLALRPVPVTPAAPKEGEEGSDKEAEGKDGETAEKPPPANAKTGIKLRFDWDEPVAAAVFRRVGYVWIVFDKVGKFDVQALLKAGAGIIHGIDQAPSPKATVLRVKVSKQVNPRLSRNGLSWIIDFKEQPLRVAAPIEIKAKPVSPVGPHIFLPVTAPGQPVGITDPAIGDNLVVVPVIPLGHGTAKKYSYTQVRLLPTAQGVVIQPLVDDLRVRSMRQGVELTSGAKLALSSVSDDVAANAKLRASKALTTVFDLDKWELKSIKNFNKRKQRLQRDVAFSRGEQREPKRYDLARFFFANRFAAETIGILNRMKDDRPAIENEPEFRLIRGGAGYLMGRLGDAAADFTHDSLDGNDEANFWRAAVVAASGDLLAAAPELRRTGSVTRKYPRALKLLMGTLVADGAVEIGDIKTAKAYIEAVKALKPDAVETAQIGYVEGRLLDLGGDTDGAVTKWEEVKESSHRPSRARATIARMELLLKLERMSGKEAIEELEKLRFAWRGDDFEFNLLRRLGSLYLGEGIYRNGLQALRQAATYFRDNEEATQVTQKMADIFNDLYLRDKADDMPPVTAIAVYEEFKELTPAGAKGDEMIRKLADRLAGVDLLDQAAEILENQIRFRLKSELKAEVGARLSVVYLLAKRYDRALAALDATNEPGLPEQLSTQRRHLRARSLMGLDRGEEALDLLKKDKANDADLLRAEIYRLAGDWSNASQPLRKIVRAGGAKKDEPLTPEQARSVLTYAISLVLSGNERALGRVRRDYGRAVEATELKDAFRLVSAPTALGLIEPGTVRSRVKLAENFQTFMSAYKKRLKEKGLSGLTGISERQVGS